jgi:hypothetical protein
VHGEAEAVATAPGLRVAMSWRREGLKCGGGRRRRWDVDNQVAIDVAARGRCPW